MASRGPRERRLTGRKTKSAQQGAVGEALQRSRFANIGRRAPVRLNGWISRWRRGWSYRGFGGRAVATDEHAFARQLLERAQRTGLVQAAFGATHAGVTRRLCKRGAGGARSIAQAVGTDFCGGVVAHSLYFAAFMESWQKGPQISVVLDALRTWL